MKIKYENSLGQDINLKSQNFILNEHDLRNYEWQYTTINRPSGRGGRVRKFVRNVTEKQITLAIRNKGTALDDNMRLLQSITEPDILAATPGKLWINDEYLVCYLAVSSSVINYSERVGFAEKELKLVVVEPFWFKEITQKFISDQGQGVQIEGVKRFTLRYPFRYASSYSSNTVYNPSHADTPAIITIYGPVIDPDITIAENHYAVKIELLENERLVINQLNNTIVKIDASGYQFNYFDARNKEYDVFKWIPKGDVQVLFTGGWSFELTLLQQRSEPSWN